MRPRSRCDRAMILVGFAVGNTHPAIRFGLCRWGDDLRRSKRPRPRDAREVRSFTTVALKLPCLLPHSLTHTPASVAHSLTLLSAHSLTRRACTHSHDGHALTHPTGMHSLTRRACTHSHDGHALTHTTGMHSLTLRRALTHTPATALTHTTVMQRQLAARVVVCHAWICRHDVAGHQRWLAG